MVSKSMISTKCLDIVNEATDIHSSYMSSPSILLLFHNMCSSHVMYCTRVQMLHVASDR